MEDIELFIISLLFMEYTVDNIKAIVKTDNIEQIINKYDKFVLIDSKNTINLY